MEFLQSLSETGFLAWVRESESVWAYPTVLFVHSLGMSMLVGFVSIIDVRLLGMAPSVPLAPLRRLMPYVWAGFVINLASGALLFLIDPTKLLNPVFWVKLTLIAAGLYSVRLIDQRVFAVPETESQSLSAGTRALAAASLACWLSAIAAGRLMAYFGNAR